MRTQSQSWYINPREEEIDSALVRTLHESPVDKSIALIRPQDPMYDSLRVALIDYRKLVIDPDSPFFDAPGNEPLRIDRVAWLRRLFDLACAEYDRLNLDRDDPVTELEAEFGKGLEGVSEQETRARLVRIERTLTEWSQARKLYGNLYDDVLKLKYLHQRYTNYLRWLTTK